MSNPQVWHVSITVKHPGAPDTRHEMDMRVDPPFSFAQGTAETRAIKQLEEQYPGSAAYCTRSWFVREEAAR